ncbi:hypothetical protein GCM10020001_102120 [Nonomuraea salmonea]
MYHTAAGTPVSSKSTMNTQTCPSAARTAPLSSPEAIAPGRVRTARPTSATITFDSSTITASCNAIAGTATSAFATPSRAPTTTSPVRATRLTSGAIPTKAATSRPPASRRGGRPSSEKYSGRNVSSPPPMKTGPRIQPSSHAA